MNDQTQITLGLLVAVFAVLAVVYGYVAKSKEKARDKTEQESISLAVLNTKVDLILANQTQQNAAIGALEARVRILEQAP